jgi:pyruvate formate lyase activating enzyme
VHDIEGGTTFCPGCQAAVIVRDWHQINAYSVTAHGKCPHCATPLAGVYDSAHGKFGRRRIPVVMSRR